MSERQDDARDEALERRARELFDASVDALDAGTRSRLARARHAAIAGLESRRRPAWQWWVPAAVAASAALVAVLVWRAPEDAAPAVAQSVNGDAVDALELVAAGDDLDLVAEDLAFYAWLDEVAPEVLQGQGSTT
jgi:hypothetical protein